MGHQCRITLARVLTIRMVERLSFLELLLMLIRIRFFTAYAAFSIIWKHEGCYAD